MYLCTNSKNHIPNGLLRVLEFTIQKWKTQYKNTTYYICPEFLGSVEIISFSGHTVDLCFSKQGKIYLRGKV